MIKDVDILYRAGDYVVDKNESCLGYDVYRLVRDGNDTELHWLSLHQGWDEKFQTRNSEVALERAKKEADRYFESKNRCY